MKKEELFDIIGDVDEQKVAAAGMAMNTQKKSRPSWLKWGVIAACLCLVVAGTIFWQKTAKPDQVESGIILSENGVTIPKMEISISQESEAEMIPFFIYHGNCYVQYESMDDTGIAGEYLGTATGLISEGAAQDGYVELAGSVKGDFFAVKGYDPAFMLCMKEATGEVSTYICNNGITLKYGADLYETRLHLSDHYTAVQYETRESWYFGKNELYQLNGNDVVIRSFIEQMDQAEFVPLDGVAAGNGMTPSSFIDDTEIYHVYFKMENGTTVHLRLHENGFVRFQGLLDICVQLPKDSFDSLIELMQNHIDSEEIAVASQIEMKLEKCKNDPELGGLIPSYEVPGSTLMVADISYYLEPQTGVNKGTKEIYLDYTSAADPKQYYGITITWKEEYGKNGWAGPMIDHSELSAEALAEYEHIKSTGVSKIDVGVWYDDASVVLMSSGIGAEEAFEIFNSIQ